MRSYSVKRHVCHVVAEGEQRDKRDAQGRAHARNHVCHVVAEGEQRDKRDAFFVGSRAQSRLSKSHFFRRFDLSKSCESRENVTNVLDVEGINQFFSYLPFPGDFSRARARSEFVTLKR